jgi:Ser/Thr protein kinase RdoA (MazF antagonist)
MNVDAVRAVLAEYGRPWDSTHAVAAPASGGFSGGAVWKVDVHGRCAALRRWPDDFPRDRLARLHGLLALFRKRGLLFSPNPLPSRDGASVVKIGRGLWDLCDWIPGEPDSGGALNLARIHSAVDCLRRTHLLSSDPDVARLAQAMDPGEAADALAAGRTAPSLGAIRRLNEWKRLRTIPPSAADCTGDPDQLGPRSLQLAAREEVWMNGLDALVKLRLPMKICWRDAHRGNVLFQGDEVAGVVDYGAIGVDAPAADYGRLLGSWLPKEPHRWAPILESAAGGSVDAERLARLSWDFHRSGLVVAMLHWREWLLVERRPFADRSAAYARWRSIVETLESTPAQVDVAGGARPSP